MDPLPAAGGASPQGAGGDAADEAASQRLLARRDAILHAVSEASERLLSPVPWHESVDAALRLLGEATGVSRVYIFEIFRRTDAETLVGQRYEWVAAGVEPQIYNQALQAVDLHDAGFRRWEELLEAGWPVVGDIEDFPAEERALLEMQGIESILVQPIFAGSHWWGFIGFDACGGRQQWHRVEVDALRIAALVLGSTIHLQHRESHFRQAQKMEALGRMAGGVAHDFNNVLMIIGTGTDMLRRGLRKGLDGEKLDAQLRLIEQAASQAKGLTKRLLAFSRQREGHARRFCPLEKIRNDRDLLQQAVGSGVAIEIDFDGEIAPISLDPTQFEQVALNLAVNARDAMPSGGRLQFAVRTLDADHDPALGDRVPEGRWTLLRVVDSGQGIPPEVRERIFEPFFSTKSADRGTGLGLSTVYGIVSNAGGRIAVSSEVGRGTEFRIYLPAADAAERTVAEAPAASPRRGERILVVDDNAPIREWLVATLEAEGYPVRSAGSPAAALAMPEILAGSIDLLITDVVMPGMSGPALRREIVAKIPAVAAIFISGFAADTLEREGLDRDREILLHKPFGREELLEAVRRVLGASTPSGGGGERPSPSP